MADHTSRVDRDSWFNKISPPSETGPGAGAGYLDGLMGNQAGLNRKQFLQVANRKQNNARVGQKPRPKADRNNIPVKSTALLLEVDDKQWLEERRRKFPKADEADRPDPASGPNGGRDTGLSSPSISNEVDSPCPEMEVKIPGTNPPNRRKKTLFEKLMESSD